MFSCKEEHFYAFAAESQDVVTSATVAIGVLELELRRLQIDVQILRGVVSPHRR